MALPLPFHNLFPLQMFQGESRSEGHADENTMIIYLLTIPFAILGIAIAIVPLLIGMKLQGNEDSQLALNMSKIASESTVESHQLELAA